MRKNNLISFKPRTSATIKDFLNQTFKDKVDSLSSFKFPLHVLFPETFIFNITKFQRVLKSNHVQGKIYFACKANKASTFLDMAAYSQIGVEASSCYELKGALKSGLKGEDVVASGPVKSLDFLSLAIRNNSIISIDDLVEITQISNICSASSQKIAPRIIIRINFSNNHISKFGIPVDKLRLAFKMIKNSGFNLLGFSFHLNNYSIDERIRSLACVFEQIKIARSYGFKADIVDIGGGYTVNYISQMDWHNFLEIKKSGCAAEIFFNSKKITDFYPYYSQYSGEVFLDKLLKSSYDGLLIRDTINDLGVKLIVEAGRSLLDQCGITLMKIVGIKQIKGENLIFVDGNINHLSEQWFNSDFLVDPILIKKNKGLTKRKTVIGPVCGNLCLEQDMLSWHRVRLNNPVAGDFLVFINTAGYQMDSNESQFHGIPLPAKFSAIQVDREWKICEDKKFNYLKIKKYDLR